MATIKGKNVLPMEIDNSYKDLKLRNHKILTTTKGPLMLVIISSG